jgi:hypothetical protein
MNLTAREEFKGLNMKLTGLRIDNIAIEAEIREAEKALELLNNRFITDIANQIDPDTCKAKYSNAEKRDAELMVRQTSSEEWVMLSEKIDGMRVIAAKVKVECMSLQNEIHYLLNHVSDEFEGELRAFRSQVSEEIQQSAALYARKYIIDMLSGIQVNLDIEDPQPPTFVNQGFELGKTPVDPYARED